MFIDERKQEGIPVALLVLCRLDEGDDPEQMSEAQRRLADWVQGRPGTYLIDTIDILKDEISLGDRVYPGDNHPNARVHRLYAEAIYPQFMGILEGAGKFSAPERQGLTERR